MNQLLPRGAHRLRQNLRRQGPVIGFDVSRHRSSWRGFLVASVLALALVANAASAPQSVWRLRGQAGEDGLSAAEFSRLARDLSEDGGYFRSDNFTSNETSYLHVVGKLRELGVTGGAYIGVGPEQNFTYIAKVRPRIAFLIDIRRQAIIQHLMFKAIFHLATSRAQYLSLLLSKPLHRDNAPLPETPVTEILKLISKVPADDAAYASNLAAIRRKIKEDFQIQLSEADQTSLDYVYRNFRDDGLNIAYRMEGSRGGWFPSLKELIVEPDQYGKLGNFLATKEDYEFVRDLHRKNLVIPVVGDFAGKKAMAGIGDYLRKGGITVSAFYTSNVEQYLVPERRVQRLRGECAQAANNRQEPFHPRSAQHPLYASGTTRRTSDNDVIAADKCLPQRLRRGPLSDLHRSCYDSLHRALGPLVASIVHFSTGSGLSGNSEGSFPLCTSIQL